MHLMDAFFPTVDLTITYAMNTNLVFMHIYCEIGRLDFLLENVRTEFCSFRILFSNLCNISLCHMRGGYVNRGHIGLCEPAKSIFSYDRPL